MQGNIYILYPYLYPAYKAGGPSRSLKNLADLWVSETTVLHFLSLQTDIDGTILPVEPNTWQTQGNTKVFYIGAAKKSISIFNFSRGLKKEDRVFVNGIFDLWFNILPLLLTQPGKVILSPRGMLHPQALQQKSRKKKIFLQFLKLCAQPGKWHYHATNEEESIYIKHIMGNSTKVSVIPNLPHFLQYHRPPSKTRGSLHMAIVALVSPMKNHLKILEALLQVRAKVHFEIYGPVKEQAYWQECESLIERLPSNIQVTYKGIAAPDQIDMIWKRQHIAILPSKSENFGHAHVEALSAGKPLITSTTVPWLHLKASNAGYNIDMEKTDTHAQLATAIEHYADMGEEELSVHCSNAVAYIHRQINTKKILDDYEELFL